MTSRTEPYTELCKSTTDRILVRGVDLCADLIGKVTFTDMMFFDIFGRRPTSVESQIIDVVLITLMEHGLTPSAIAARMTYGGAPEAMQGAVAAGLLGGGNVLLGTLENCARLLNQIVSDTAGVESAAAKVAIDHKNAGIPVTGFGHPYHKPDDPRTVKLFALARSLGVPGKHINACEVLSREVDKAYGKHLTVNASAACGALMCEINVPVEIMRGFALVTRAAGLIAHIYEEIRRPTMWPVTKAANEAVPYKAP